jgi:hypothetical protein
MKLNEGVCAGVKPDGTQCQAAALTGSDFCYFHDPSKAAERRESQAQGGRHNRMKAVDPGAPVIDIRDSRDVVTLLGDTVDQVRKGQIDPRVANSVGYLCAQIMKAFAQRNQDDRIESLEQALENREDIPEPNLTGTSDDEVTN